MCYFEGFVIYKSIKSISANYAGNGQCVDPLMPYMVAVCKWWEESGKDAGKMVAGTMVYTCIYLLSFPILLIRNIRKMKVQNGKRQS